MKEALRAAIARNAVRNHRRSAGYRRSLPLSPRLAAPESLPQEEDGGSDARRRALAESAVHAREACRLAPYNPDNTT